MRSPVPIESARCRATLPVRILAALIVASAPVWSLAAPPLKAVEECLESGTDLVNLPGAAGGSLLASQCRGCPSVRLSFDARTRYYIGKQPVPYAQLREAAARGNTRLYLFYRPGDRTLTRLRLAAAAK